jgi:hypothetical protein
VKEIRLTQGKVALVDNDDYEKLNKYKWYAHRGSTGGFYAIRWGKKGGTYEGKKIKMHREIMCFPSMCIDHINNDGLDNQKHNLRICDSSKNNYNKKLQKNNTSGLIGVTWHKRHKKWYAFIAKNRKRFFLGSFGTKKEASDKRDKKAIKLFGEFAVLNNYHGK